MSNPPTTEVLWAVYTNTDTTEGRGREYVKHFCRLRATALRLGRKGYVQGGDCPVKPVEVLVLDGKRVLPMSVIAIENATAADEAAEARWLSRESVIERAKGLGLTQDEINLIAGGAP